MKGAVMQLSLMGCYDPLGGNLGQKGLREAWEKIAPHCESQEDVAVATLNGVLGAMIEIDYAEDREPSDKDRELVTVTMAGLHPHASFWIQGEGHGFYGTGCCQAFVPMEQIDSLKGIQNQLLGIMYR